jgi:hypothetical protein
MNKPDIILTTLKFDYLGAVFDIKIRRLEGRDGYLLDLAYTVGGGSKTQLAAEMGEPYAFLQAIVHLAPTLRQG